MTRVRNSRLSAVELLVFIVFTFSVVITILGVALELLTGHAAANHDYVSYWASGRQLVSHLNPYDSGAIFNLERDSGFPANAHALLMRNPPFALLLTIPLGSLGVRVGSILWSTALVGSLLLSLWMIARLYGRSNDRLHWAGLCFAPALACLATGQTAIFCLLGLTLFLCLHRSRPLSAGVALWLCALKPHLFLPFGVALPLWVVWEKAYRILAGFALALIASMAIAFSLDPAIWPQYTQMMHGSAIDQEFIPTLSLLLRLAIKPDLLWLQSLPAIARCVWAVWYALRHRNAWDWLTHGSLVLMVSLLVAPYAWLSDQAALWPAILSGIYLSRRKSLVPLMGLNALALSAILWGVSFHSWLYIFAVPAWLAWYLFATRSAKVRQTHRANLSPAPS